MAIADTLALIHSSISPSVTLQFLAGALLLSLFWLYTSTRVRPIPGIPVVELDHGKKKAGGLPWQHSHEFLEHAKEMLAQGKAMTNNGIFQIKSPVGYKVMLPPVFANELRNNPDLSFAKSMQLDFHTHLPGFAPIEQGIRNDGLLVDVVRLKLTQSLGPITEDIVEEADLAIQRWPGKAPGPAWKTVSIKEGLLDVISRVSGRVFGGEQLSRDEEWLEINKQYTSESFGLAMRLHAWPMLLRRIANWVLEPAGKNIRAQIAAAQRLVAPQVEQRLKAREDALAKGIRNKGQNDVFHWLLDVAKGRKFDFAIAQLGISVAALHTTTEMNSQCLLFAAQHPEVVAALREEMVQVLREGGWAKTTLYKLKLLDSFIKECQRLHGPSTNSMIRVCQAPVTLSTGLTLPAGTYISLRDDLRMDPQVYENPEKFDAWRYLKMRQRPGEENQHQFATTSPENMGFGHGMHACPGRFFASNEIKILMCILLLKYDWRYGDEQKEMLPPLCVENVLLVDPRNKLQCRERVPEIDLLNPTA